MIAIWYDYKLELRMDRERGGKHEDYRLAKRHRDITYSCNEEGHQYGRFGR